MAERLPDRICPACLAGKHRACPDKQSPAPGVVYCTCANSVHEVHYDAEGQLRYRTEEAW